MTAPRARPDTMPGAAQSGDAETGAQLEREAREDHTETLERSQQAGGSNSSSSSLAIPLTILINNN